jgi:hypothetical protein
VTVDRAGDRSSNWSWLLHLLLRGNVARRQERHKDSSDEDRFDLFH